MSVGRYASPALADSIARQLDVMILGASEVDMDFNVNVTCAGNGRIIGGSGGHADTAAGAALQIVTTNLSAGGYPKLVKRLSCLTKPGKTIGAVVTEEGIAIHPSRPKLSAAARRSGLPLTTLNELRRKAEVLTPPQATGRGRGRLVAICEAPDGTQIDKIRAI